MIITREAIMLCSSWGQAQHASVLRSFYVGPRSFGSRVTGNGTVGMMIYSIVRSRCIRHQWRACVRASSGMPWYMRSRLGNSWESPLTRDCLVRSPYYKGLLMSHTTTQVPQLANLDNNSCQNRISPSPRLHWEKPQPTTSPKTNYPNINKNLQKPRIAPIIAWLIYGTRKRLHHREGVDLIAVI